MLCSHRSRATTRPSSTHAPNKPGLQSTYLSGLRRSACCSLSLHRPVLTSLRIVGTMYSLVALAATLMGKLIMFVSLHGGSRTLADNTSPNDMCYWPNGDLTGTGVPCTYDGSVGNCCSPGFACMNTGICKLDGAEYYERHSCTDSSWLDPSCSQMCIEGISFARPLHVCQCSNLY